MERLSPSSSEYIRDLSKKSNWLRGRARLLVPLFATLAVLTSPTTSTKVGAEGQGFTTDQSRVVEVYTQCGGEGYSDKTTVMVQRVRNPDGFNIVGLGEIAGECGNRYTQPDSEVQKLDQVQSQSNPISISTADGRTFDFSRRYSQCGGSIGAMDFKPEHTVIVNEFVHNQSGDRTYSWHDVGPQPGQCGN